MDSTEILFIYLFIYLVIYLFIFDFVVLILFSEKISVSLKNQVVFLVSIALEAMSKSKRGEKVGCRCLRG